MSPASEKPSSEKPRVAVIGLGSMGYGMALSLKKAGFTVTGCDVSADAVKRFVTDGGQGADTPAAGPCGGASLVSALVIVAQSDTTPLWACVA